VTGKPMAQLDTYEEKLGSCRTPSHVAISAHGLLAGVTTDGAVLIWRAQDGAKGWHPAFRGFKFAPVGCGPAQVAWSPDGKRLLVQTYSGVVLVFRP
jgi:hypothetical protein